MRAITLSVAALVACGGSKLDRERMEKMKAELCACTSQDCVDKVRQANTDLTKANDEKLKNGELSQEDGVLVMDTRIAMNQCERAMNEKRRPGPVPPPKLSVDAAAIKKKLQGTWSLTMPDFDPMELTVAGDEATLSATVANPDVIKGELVISQPHKLTIKNPDNGKTLHFFEDAAGGLHVHRTARPLPFARERFTVELGDSFLTFANGKCTMTIKRVDVAPEAAECGFRKAGDLETFWYKAAWDAPETLLEVHGDILVPLALAKSQATRKK